MTVYIKHFHIPLRCKMPLYSTQRMKRLWCITQMYSSRKISAIAAYLPLLLQCPSVMSNAQRSAMIQQKQHETASFLLLCCPSHPSQGDALRKQCHKQHLECSVTADCQSKAHDWLWSVSAMVSQSVRSNSRGCMVQFTLQLVLLILLKLAVYFNGRRLLPWF